MTKEVKVELTESQKARITAATEKSTSKSKGIGTESPVPESTAGRISREALRAIGEEGRRDVRAAEAGVPDAEAEDQGLRGPDVAKPKAGEGTGSSDSEVRPESEKFTSR